MGNIILKDPTNLEEITQKISTEVGCEIPVECVEKYVVTKGTAIYFVNKNNVKGLDTNVFCTVRIKEKYAKVNEVND